MPSENISLRNYSRSMTDLSAGALNADLVPTTDVSQFSVVSVQTGGTFSGTLTFQGSNDNTNWSNVLLNNVASVGAPVASTTSSGILYTGAGPFRYFRVRMTAYTSGTATGAAMFSGEGFASPVGIQAVSQSTAAAVTAPWPTSETPKTTGGLLSTNLVSAASTNATVVKATAGAVYAIFASNANAAWRYLKVYNKATAPTVGTDVPVITIGIPPNDTVSHTLPGGHTNTTGIGIALTTESTTAGTTAVAANEIVVNIAYK
jgi:hypothetical protein